MKTRPRFEDLMAQFEPMVARICTSYERDRDLARELAQEAWFAVCVAYVLVLYFADIGSPQAAYHDSGRVIVALAIFALYAVGVGVYHRYARRRLRRFTQIRQEMTASTGAG